jgi:hypothetical protein
LLKPPTGNGLASMILTQQNVHTSVSSHDASSNNRWMSADRKRRLMVD